MLPKSLIKLIMYPVMRLEWRCVCKWVCDFIDDHYFLFAGIILPCKKQEYTYTFRLNRNIFGHKFAHMSNTGCNVYIGALNGAIDKKNYIIVKYLLKMNIDEDYKGYCFSRACYYGKIKIARIFLENGVEPEYKTYKNAVLSGNIRLLKLLSKSSNFDIVYVIDKCVRFNKYFAARMIFKLFKEEAIENKMRLKMVSRGFHNKIFKLVLKL